VPLEGLPSGNAQGAVGVLGGDAVERQPLGRRHHTTGNARADHEGIGRLELLPTTLVAQVAIVLLVAAVELEQLVVVVADRTGDRVGQAFDDAATQQPAGGLDPLHLGHRCSGLGHIGGSGSAHRQYTSRA
jgi:hypothetical protein